MNGLFGVRDPHADHHGHIGDGFQASRQRRGGVGEAGAFTGHAQEADRIHETSSSGTHTRQTFVGRRRGGQHDGGQAVGVSGLTPRTGFLERKIGNDRSHDAGRRQLGREPFVTRMMNGVVVTHHDQRHFDVETTRLLQNRDRCRTGIEGSLRSFLDYRTIHHGIGKRQANLDHVGTVGSRRPYAVLPTG